MLLLLANILSREFVEGDSAKRPLEPGRALRGTGNTTRKDKGNDRSHALRAGARAQVEAVRDGGVATGTALGGQMEDGVAECIIL